MTNDEQYMHHALAIGRRGLGQTAPNPSVGCIIVRDNIILGRGVTAKGGRPHAETQALSEAGDTKGATAYVTLEPCSHEGHTPPCSKTLIKAGISRVVIAMQDPDPRVSGRGIKQLQEAGIEVVIGVCENEAKLTHRGHTTRILHHRPFVQLKLALSHDGFIAGAGNKQVQISGEEAWRFTHMLRAQTDAILVGNGTYKADNPQLNCRLPGMSNRSPRKIILTSDISLESVMEDKSITRLLVEGGAKVATSFLKAGLVDEIILIKSKAVMIGNGVKPFPLNYLNAFTLGSRQETAEDMIEIYRQV
jgi:diaminohydroxyphosphoribosylaminopyrimidine deaminase / 5-amino-6-(5-phosphoribosylamino)uracil reductase